MTDIRSNLVAFDAGSDNEPIAFDLQKFLPFQVRLFHSDVISALLLLYQPKYGMTSAEWFTLLAIGPEDKLSSQEIVVNADMDKASISRALERMRQYGWIEISANTADGRSKLISLSAAGRAIYFDLTPKALQIEDKLLKDVSEEELREFINTMSVISANCRKP